jgi:hypothetical protein
MYKILPYSYKKAKMLGLTIKPSQSKNKKIDVYQNGDFLYSIGSKTYLDFPTMAQYDLNYALERRRLYHLRHRKDNVYGTRGWASLNILW